LVSPVVLNDRSGQRTMKQVASTWAHIRSIASNMQALERHPEICCREVDRRRAPSDRSPFEDCPSRASSRLNPGSRIDDGAHHDPERSLEPKCCFPVDIELRPEINPCVARVRSKFNLRPFVCCKHLEARNDAPTTVVDDIACRCRGHTVGDCHG